VKLKTLGPQTVTVRNVSDPSMQGARVVIVIRPEEDDHNDHDDGDRGDGDHDDEDEAGDSDRD
jgi:hypothetical protein